VALASFLNTGANRGQLAWRLQEITTRPLRTVNLNVKLPPIELRNGREPEYSLGTAT